MKFGYEYEHAFGCARLVFDSASFSRLAVGGKGKLNS